MQKPTGRHRKPVRGWGQRVRWLFGAVLTAVLCSPLQVRPDRNVDRRSGGGRLALECRSRSKALPAATHQVRSTGPKVLGEAGKEHEPGPVRVPRPRCPHPSEQQGWCVDDDGVRGVRPYLFHTPKRGSRFPVAEAPGEFDDLAGAVRTWLSLAT